MIDTLRGYLPTNSMRSLIRDNSMLLPAISRFGIPFGFGDRTVAEVCSDAGVDLRTFLSVCNLLSGYQYATDNLHLPTLTGYLKRAHTSFLDVMLPRIRLHLIEGINYTGSNEVALLLIKFFDDYVEEVKTHMEGENTEVFAHVEMLIQGKSDPSSPFRISSFSGNHEPMAAKLNELKDIFIYHFNQPENMRLSAALFDIIQCERDLMAHFEVENNLFFPAVARLEQELARDTPAPSDATQPSTSASMLSSREKDIVSNLARGLSNKEIADRLCISVHTVATHRRNIIAKLGIHSPAGLVIFAIINGLVDIAEVKPV